MRKDKFMKEGHHRGDHHKGRDRLHHCERAIAFLKW